MTPRVLIVEDSPAMRQLLAFALAHSAHAIIDVAADGVSALKALKTSPAPYDLVFLDLNMPILDGMKVLARMREDPACAHTTVCVVTTDEDEGTEKRAREMGAHYYLRKPVSRRSIEQVVAEVFGEPSSS